VHDQLLLILIMMIVVSHIYYKVAFWREKGFSGEINSDGSIPTHYVNDIIENTQFVPGSDNVMAPCLVGYDVPHYIDLYQVILSMLLSTRFICGKQAMKVAVLSKDERLQLIKNQFSSFHNSFDNRFVILLIDFMFT
jgi:hypothetical protein